jgi:hypothetical protein
MLGMVALPAGLTLHSVRVAAVPYIPGANPTPHGYTWSLLLFLAPIAVIAGWFLPSERVQVPKRAFWCTLALLVPLGFALDFFFASRFFVFPNAGATLGIAAPALGHSVPIEEYAFYFSGFLAVLLLYIWLGEYWLAAYSVPNARGTEAPGEERALRRLLGFHPASAIAGVALIAAGIAWKKLLSPVPEGFPGYFTFIVGGALVPSATLFPAARRLINWHALSATMFIIVLISLIWEVTLALPYGWWGFQPQAMVGLPIRAWSGLPIEEVIVWVAVTYATVIVYEVMKAWLWTRREGRNTAASLHLDVRTRAAP